MFRHESRLQSDAKPDRPDAVFAKLLQEPLAGQASEMTGMMQFLIQGFNCRGPAKYRDLLIATGTEEIAHVELVATMIARDTMHQNQFLAAIEELEADGLETTPVPSAFPKALENEDVAYQFWNLTDGTAAGDGRWASGKAPDGHGKFEFVKRPEPLGGAAELGRSNPRGLGTEPKPAKLAQKLVSGS